MLSPSLSRTTKRMRPSITERSFHGIHLFPPQKEKSVTHVSGTFCYLCLRPLKRKQQGNRSLRIHHYSGVGNATTAPVGDLIRTEFLDPGFSHRGGRLKGAPVGHELGEKLAGGHVLELVEDISFRARQRK